MHAVFQTKSSQDQIQSEPQTHVIEKSRDSCDILKTPSSHVLYLMQGQDKNLRAN